MPSMFTGSFVCGLTTFQDDYDALTRRINATFGILLHAIAKMTTDAAMRAPT